MAHFQSIAGPESVDVQAGLDHPEPKGGESVLGGLSDQGRMRGEHARVADSRGREAVAPRAVGQAAGADRKRYRTLLVDLNNFATFPTLAVGILVAALRDAGHAAHLLVPLAHDVPAAERERRETYADHVKRRVHLSTMSALRWSRDAIRSVHYWRQRRPHARTLREVARALEAKPDVLMLSAYLQHHASLIEIGKLAKKAGVPLLLGGPAFNLPGTTEAWRTIPGLTAIFGGEADLVIADLVETVVEGGDLLRFPGIVLPDGRRAPPAPPLRGLDRSPLPDLTDFPWDRYRVRIIPVMTGRGCQWGKCRFCSDVVSANGRTYRTRSLDSVLYEMEEQARRHATNNFLFLDLKLNSNPNLFRGIADQAQDVVPGAQWIGTVHVDLRADNGLSRQDLKAAAAGGMRRVSFGFESGSQRMLDLMDKGSTVAAASQFVRHSHEAGISVRCTMFKGYPGETADDLTATAEFLETHARYIDRVRFNDFSILENTPIWHDVFSDTPPPAIQVLQRDMRHAKVRYVNRESTGQAYRRAKSRVMAAVYAINRRTLPPGAQMFDGMM